MSIYFNDPNKDTYRMYLDFITENRIVTRDNLELRLDEWKPGKKNILFITGLSGSGKSTLASQLGKARNAVNVELDLIQHNNIVFDNRLENDEGNLIIREYFLKRFGKSRKLKQGETIPLVTDFLRYLKSYASRNKDKLFVCEGIQLMNEGPAELIKDDPIIIVNTSQIKSMIRNLKRAGKGERKQTLSEFPQWVAWYNDQVKSKRIFTNEVQE